jgi:hypothetical protein
MKAGVSTSRPTASGVAGVPARARSRKSGMMMLPPATVALPFKLIFFVLVDGWTLVAGSLVQALQSARGRARRSSVGRGRARPPRH